MFGVMALLSVAQESVQENPGGKGAVGATNVVIKQIGSDRLQIGEVVLDRRASSVSFPCQVNMDRPPVEYFLVTGGGKLHESILKTSVEPHHIHVAMLLLGAKGAPEGQRQDFQDPATSIPGESVEVRVAWKAEEKEISMRAEAWVENLEKKAPMTEGPWTYNGSLMVNGQFLAAKEGSIVSLIADPVALVNNPRPGRENDEIWSVNTNKVPKVGTPVTVTISLSKPIKPASGRGGSGN